jgi:hypothetical protein
MDDKKSNPVILKTINLDNNQSKPDSGNGATLSGSC